MRRFLQFTLSLCLMLVALTANAEKSPYTLTYDKSAELLKLVKEGCTSYEATYAGQATLEGYDGFFSFNPQDSDWDFVNECLGAYVSLADGDYTLKVAAGTYKFDGVENEAFEIPFTVGEKQQGGGDSGNFDGEKWQETIFEAGMTSVTVPVAFETEGVTITTEGREFMGTTIDVVYNTYEENEIDWNNGTKLVITAKDNISGIVIDGQFVAFASADKGVYSNGKWTGALMKGETLTLTAGDGILIKKLVVLYNGDEYNAEEEDVNTGNISIAYPVADQLVASIADRGKLATFTTTKEYEQVIINIDDEDEAFNNIYKFPTRMVDNNGENKDNLHVGENTITASTPDGKTYYFFKGHTYTMTIKGYVHMYDVLSDTYDAVATVKFVGNGKEAEKLSDITIDKIFPKNGTVLPEGPRTVDITFSAPVKTLKAVMPKGMEGSATYSCTKVDEAGLSWNVNLGDLTVVSEGGEESGMTLEISGTDVDGNVLNLGVNAAHALILSYTISKNAQEPEHEVDVDIVPAFLNGEEEITLNDHSSVSVEKANALKVGFGDNAAVVKYATYQIEEWVVGEDWMGPFEQWEELTSGTLGLNGFGYAEFDGAIKFNAGTKYNVIIKAWDVTADEVFNLETFESKEPVATFACEFNGAYSEESGAALVVDGESIALSTETATEFGSLPAGSVFKYTVTKEDTKTVQFQLYDVTAGVIIKSMAMKQDANGLAGTVEFDLPIKYELAKGHEYEAQFKEYNAVNGLTIKAPTATANYKFTGIADVAVYSTVKVASVSPATSEDINDLDTPVVITFTDAIASLDVTAVIGQMSAVAVAAANITPNEDKTAWTVALNENYVSSGTIQLNFYAIDNEGNRVTDPNNGVGTPETCYVNYSWATTIGLPTPTLAENGKTYETVEAITFENDGIGLNENNANATWSQITIEKDGTPLNLAITEDMFEVAGDASVGGTKLILSLPTLYKGVYTVKVPARAFMLGHDIDNTYNGACSFTFTCTAEEKEPVLANGDYVIKNVEAGKFLNGSNDWGTKVSVTTHAQFMTIALNDGKYSIKSHYSNGGGKDYVAAGDNTYLDAAVTYHEIEEVEGGFTIKDANGKYLVSDGNVANFNGDEPQAWQFISKEQYIAEAVELAETGTPADLTGLVPDANFSRNNQDINLWEGESKMGKGGPNNAKDATAAGMNAERWGGNSTSIDFHTTVADLPNGKYLVRFQGYYRYNNTTENSNAVAEASHADGTEKIIVTFSANETSVPFMSIADEASVELYGKLPFSQAEASEAFTMGAYQNEFEVEVTEGTLTLAVTKNEADHEGCDWTVLDNIELYYLGEEAPAELAVSFMANDSIEYALNTHSYVTIDAPISAIKVAGLDQTLETITYAIYDKRETLAEGTLSVNTIGYAEFDEITLYEGIMYNVVLKAGEEVIYDNYVIGAVAAPAPELAEYVGKVVYIKNAETGEYLYGKDAQNTAMGSIDDTANGVVTSYKLTEIDGGYAFRCVTPNTTDYSLWGANPCYLNGQPSNTGVTFNLGKDQDIANGSTWAIEYNAEKGGWAIKNVGNGGYLNGTVTSVELESVWVLEVNEEATAISTIATSSKANGKYIENGKVVIVKNGVKYNVAGSVIK